MNILASLVMWSAYTITNKSSGKMYIGASEDYMDRWENHLRYAEGGKEKYPSHFMAIHAAIKKYGVSNFDFEAIKYFDNEEEMYFYEDDMIAYCRSLGVPLYNIAGGGKGTGSGVNHPMFGKKLPKEWLDNMSAAIKISSNNPETRAKHSANMIARNWVGENHPMFGKTHSDEARQKISAANTGRKMTEEN